MSGPVSTADTPAEPVADRPDACEIEVVEGRDTRVGSFRVNRVLPRRARRMVSAWCFLDHMGPDTVGVDRGLDVGPHPHMGLQTVTWLLDGEVLHRDSLGSEQRIRPGQLNLMTAGGGVSHSEETRGVYEGRLHGAQLWVALPEATRHGRAAFEHHSELPRLDLEHGDATVLVGALAGGASAARRDTDHVGVDLDLRPGASSLPLDPGHEYALAVLDGSVSVRGTRLAPGRLGYLGTGRDDLAVEVTDRARALLIGGAPFPDEILMWWNYVARTRSEVVAAHRSWSSDDGRFGTVASPLDRVGTGAPPWPGPGST